MEATTTPAAPAAPEATAPAAPAAPATKAAPTIESGTVQPVPGKDGEQKQPESFFGSSTMLIILAAVWIWFIYSMRKNKKKQQQRQEEMQKLGKGDHVVTIGRVHGVVVKADEKTFTIKPDSSKDFTMTFDREALLRVERADGTTVETEAK